MFRVCSAYVGRLVVGDGEGATIVEYALWGALIAVVVIAAAMFLG